MTQQKAITRDMIIGQMTAFHAQKAEKIKELQMIDGALQLCTHQLRIIDGKTAPDGTTTEELTAQRNGNPVDGQPVQD